MSKPEKTSDFKNLMNRCAKVSKDAQACLIENREFIWSVNVELVLDWWMLFLFWAQYKPLNATLH